MKKIKRNYSGTTNPEVTARERENRLLSKKAAIEGMVLLENRNSLLPLKKGIRLALYGSGADKTIKGGTGSGDVNERDSVTIYQGLVNAGFQITTAGWIQDYNRTYEQARKDWRDDIISRTNQAGLVDFFAVYSSTPFQIPDGRAITETDVKASGTDTAVFVVSRIAGEGSDRHAEPGDYYLQDSERKNLEYICKKYKHVILVINAGGQVDLSYVNQYDSLEGIIYMVQAGMEGGNALAELLSGTENFSGKLTDTWALAYHDYPSADTFSHNNCNVSDEYYTEGIYVGYRYFDSFRIKPQYAFGHGLSYTDFSVAADKDAVTVDEENQLIEVQAMVKNTGDQYAGKEVVQVYVSCPQRGVEKEMRRLCGFAKTAQLKPGQIETVLINFSPKAMASFDEAQSAWVLEAGLYGVWIGGSSDKVRLIAAVDIAESQILEKVESICTVQQELQEIKADRHLLKDFENKWHKELEEKGLSCVPLSVKNQKEIGTKKREADAIAARLVDKLTEEELIHMVVGEISKGQGSTALGSAGIMVPGAAGETSSILDESYHIPGISMADGPAGLRLRRTYQVSKADGSILPEDPFISFEGGFFSLEHSYDDADMYYQYCTAIPVGALLAQTWNETLLERLGEMIGKEMRLFHVTWWLAPGMNIHRNPLCGRNFEYYSEDPVVSGKIAAAITRGVQMVEGVGTTIKHFACNNQEDNRMESNSILSQRALREIYFRGFEIAVKTSQPMAIMTSYNRINGLHAANHYGLCTQVARSEWGFDGIIMTDWTTTSPHGGSEPYLCIQAGNDLIMPGTEADYENIRAALKDGRLELDDLKSCVYRLIQVILQSNAYEGAAAYGAQYGFCR